MFSLSSMAQSSRQSPHQPTPVRSISHTSIFNGHYLTSFLVPKLLASADAAERGSRRAADRGSDAADIDRGSWRGSLVGGAGVVSFELLLPCFPFLAVAASTDCGERER